MSKNFTEASGLHFRRLTQPYDDTVRYAESLLQY